MTYVLKYHVYCEAGEAERSVLALADEYRFARHASHHEEHRKIIDFRNNLFPELFAAMRLFETCKAKIYELELAIKQHHSRVRDRNAVMEEQEKALRALRDSRKALLKDVQEKRNVWFAFQAQFRLAVQQAADWKNIKTLERRIEQLARIDWEESVSAARSNAEKKFTAESPGEKRDALERKFESTWGEEFPTNWFNLYSQIVFECDLSRRRLSREYQDRGLHSSIRGEIDKATKPKLSKNGEGTRYRYGFTDKPKPWMKLSLQFSGGLLVASSFAGRNPQLEMNRRGRIIQVSQQIGTAAFPQRLTYRFKVPKSGPELPMDAKIQRMSLVVKQIPDDTPDGRWERYITFTVDKDLPPKHKGTHRLDCKLRWTMRKEGVEVAEFSSPVCRERLIVPRALIERRLAMSVAQCECDNEANRFLDKAGIDVSEIKPSGLAGLANFVHEHPGNKRADNLLLHLNRKLRHSWRIQRSAMRAIEHLYFNVAKRLAEIHGSIEIQEINLSNLKRYATRDLLKDDLLPPRSREILHAVSPGKLKSALLRAMPKASGEVTEKTPAVLACDETTNVFTTYVNSFFRSRKELCTINQ